MVLQEKINANPTVYAVSTAASHKFDVYDELDEDAAEPFEPAEVFGASAVPSSLSLCIAQVAR